MKINTHSKKQIQKGDEMMLEIAAAEVAAGAGKLLWDMYGKKFIENGESLLNRKIDDLNREVRTDKKEIEKKQLHATINPAKIKELEKRIRDKEEKTSQLLIHLKDFQARWANFKWGTAEERYKKRIDELYGYIRVLGSLEPVDLDEVFTDVYILDKPSAS